MDKKKIKNKFKHNTAGLSTFLYEIDESWFVIKSLSRCFYRETFDIECATDKSPKMQTFKHTGIESYVHFVKWNVTKHY